MEELRKTTTKSPLPLDPVEDISQYARSVPQRYGNPGDMMVFVPINVKRIKLLEIFPKAKIIERLINLDRDSCAFEVTFYENISDDEQHFRQNCIGYSTRNIEDNFVEAARTAAYRNLFRALGVTTIAEALNDISEDSEFMEPLGYEGQATIDGITVDGTSTVGLDALEKKLLASYEKKKAESEPKPKPEAYPSPLPVAKATSDVAPILWQYGALARLKKGESIHKLLHGGYSTISLGYAGLYECVKYMTGNSHTDGAKGEEFGLEVMQKLNDKCKEWKEAEDIDYSVYGTPIESTTYKFAKCLQRRFGKIKGITDRNYITNSYHVPVFEEIDAFSKLKLESKFQRLSPGGAISYVETPNLQDNLEVVLQIIKFIYDNIMYAELNTKSDYCQKCGFDGEILLDDNLEWYCPNCGNRDHSTLNVARRTCGYIGSNFWNKGRTQEIKERVLHIDNKDDTKKVEKEAKKDEIQ